LEDQARLTKELDEKRLQAVEAQKRLQEERHEADERMMERMRYEQEEKEKIVHEIEQARRLAEQKALEAQQKELEARHLEEQLHEAKQKVMQATQQMANINHHNHGHHPALGEFDNNNEDDESDDEESSRNGNRGVELRSDEFAPRPEEDRITAQQKNQKMQQQLMALKDELGSVHNPQKATDNDRLHQQNVASGRDKYKTLKMIRQGNTKKRIDEFESM